MKRNRSKTPPFIALAKQGIYEHYLTGLSAKAIILYLVLLEKFNGFNQDEIWITYREILKNNVTALKSNSSIRSAQKELVEKGWIELVEQGGLNICNKFRLTGKLLKIFGSKADKKS